jgi:single cache domain-containing protein
MRRHVSWILSFLVCTSALALATKTPKANTRAEVKAYVERAAKFVAKNGPSCSALQSREWQNGEYYVFVVGPDDKLLCHPIASIVGTSADNVIDKNGKKVGTELDTVARKGGGWVDYVWPRPGTTTPVAKSTYAMEVKGPDGKMYVVGAGAYEIK